MDRAREKWPKGYPHPKGDIFALHGDEACSYIRAMNTAANYAAVNRLLLAEIARFRLREVFGFQVEAPLEFDVQNASYGKAR